MRGRLSHQFMESIRGSLPSSSLNSQECSETESKWESNHPADGGTLDYLTAKWVTEHPTGERVGDELA